MQRTNWTSQQQRQLGFPRRQFMAVVAALLATGISRRATAWEQIDDADGIRVFKREVKGSPLVAFRGETLVKAPIEKLLWVLADNTHRTEWVDRLQKSIVLQKSGRYEYVVYQHFDLPFPISDRDYVFRGRAAKAPGKVILHLESVNHPKAPATVGVRANLIKSKYELIPKGKDQTIVIVEIHTDPKGLVPSWLVNLIQKSWPNKTLGALRKQVQQPYVGRLAVPS